MTEKLVRLAAEAMDAFWARRGGRHLTVAEAEAVVAAIEPEIAAMVDAAVAAWAKTTKIGIGTVIESLHQIEDGLDEAGQP